MTTYTKIEYVTHYELTQKEFADFINARYEILIKHATGKHSEAYYLTKKLLFKYDRMDLTIYNRLVSFCDSYITKTDYINDDNSEEAICDMTKYLIQLINEDADTEDELKIYISEY